MSLRFSTICLLSLLLGCAAAEVATEPTADAEAGSSQRVLELENTAAVVSMLPGDTFDLAVRYRAGSGATVAGVDVDFALAGMASGASLSPSRAQTDALGVARTKLRAGSMSGTVQVRAATSGARPVYVDVLVGAALPSKVQVRVDYAGVRELASYTITSIEDVSCVRALAGGMSGIVVHRIERKDETIQFELAAGAKTAVLAWGSDFTGAPLALGCEDVEALITVDETARKLDVTVPLADIPLRLDGELPFELSLSVAGPARRIAETAQRAVQRALSPSGRYTMFAEADYYLDAVAETLRQRGSGEALTALTNQRMSPMLAASLAPALSAAGRGPVAMGMRLGDLMAERGSILLLAGSLNGAQLRPIRSVTAQSADGTSSLELALLPGTSWSSRFDGARAELVIDSLRLELGVGAYGRALLDALRSENGAAFNAALASAAGCSEVVGAWADVQLANVCGRECAVAACQGAVSRLVGAVELALSELDAPGSAITLSGRVPAHDRSDDDEGAIDDLGPAQLQGEWSPSDSVSGELREPARNALTL